jgi:hypothetical protein
MSSARITFGRIIGEDGWVWRCACEPCRRRSFKDAVSAEAVRGPFNTKAEAEEDVEWALLLDNAPWFGHT